VGILNENCSGDYENKEDFSTALTESIHSAAAENVNELYIIVKPDFIIKFYFELGDRHSMRLKFVPDFSTISKLTLALVVLIISML
jgi:putative colanic acid biosynthesis UDP-glucose lipid carrier transferase